MCSGSEAGSYLRRIGFVCHSTLGLRVIKKKKNKEADRARHLALLARLVCLHLLLRVSGFGFRG